MKKLLSLFLIFPIVFACNSTTSSDDNEPENMFDPTIIKEYHELDQNGLVLRKYKFDDNGRVSSMENMSGTYLYSFDDLNRLISVINTNSSLNIVIDYDSNGKVQSINDRSFVYNPTITDFISSQDFTFSSSDYDNFYIESSSYFSSENPDFPDEDEIEYSFPVFFENNLGEIIGGCYHYEIILFTDSGTTFQGCESGSEIFWNYQEQNLINDGVVEAEVYYEFNDYNNPLFSENDNIINLVPFFQSDQYNFILNRRLMSSKKY